MRRCLALSVLVSATVLCSPVLHCATVNGLYSADVAVAGQGAEERQQGFRLALEAVLIKLTGNMTVAAGDKLNDLLGKSRTYVAQYRYRVWDADALLLSTTTAEPTHILEVSFSPDSLDRALNGQGLALWGADRPETLLWLAVQATNNHYILGSDGSPQILESLLGSAQKRGLPVLLPLMDLQDQSAVDFADVKGGFSGRVQQASERYGVDAILTGSVRQTASAWVSDWVLQHAGHTYNWQSTGENIERVIDSNMEHLARQLVAAFSADANPSQVSVIRLRVDRIDSLDDYAQLLNYLNGLAAVEKASLDGVTATTNDFRLIVPGGIDSLRNAIALDVLLQASDSGQSDLAGDEPLLYYEWVQ